MPFILRSERYFYTLLGGGLISPIEALGYASYFYALPYGSKLDSYRARGSSGYIPTAERAVYKKF